MVLGQSSASLPLSLVVKGFIEYRLLLQYCWLALICAVYHVLLIDYCMRNDCERKAHIAGVEPACVLVPVCTCPMSFFSTVSRQSLVTCRLQVVYARLYLKSTYDEQESSNYCCQVCFNCPALNVQINYLGRLCCVIVVSEEC